MRSDKQSKNRGWIKENIGNYVMYLVYGNRKECMEKKSKTEKENERKRKRGKEKKI